MDLHAAGRGERWPSASYDADVGFADDQLYAGEEVVLDLRPHWWFFASQAAVLLGALILGIIALVFIPEAVVWAIAAVLLLGALIWFLIRYVVWSTTSFVVTTDRLIHQEGVFNQESIQIPLDRINTVFLRRTFFERVIGSGDLEIESAGEKGSQTFADIRRPLNVQNEIYRQMEDNENRKFDRVGRNLGPLGPVGGGATSAESIPDQIEKLDLLRQKGILTDREFEDKKQELLDRM